MLVPYVYSQEHVEQLVLLATILMKGLVPSATCHVRRAQALEEINVHHVLLTGGWRRESVTPNVRRTSFLGRKVVVAATITVKTVMALGLSAVHRVHSIFH